MHEEPDSESTDSESEWSTDSESESEGPASWPLQYTKMSRYEVKGSPCCTVCWKEASKVCTKCKSVFYCTKVCQVQDWPAHKCFCSQHEALKMLLNPAESTKSSAVGLLLPENSKQPVFVRVSYEKVFKDGEVLFRVFQNKFLLRAQNEGQELISSTSIMDVNCRTKGSRKLKSMLNFCYRDSFLIDGSVANKCISALVSGDSPIAWKGPVLVFKGDCETQPPVDMDISDGRDVVDFFLSHGDMRTPTVMSRF